MREIMTRQTDQWTETPGLREVTLPKISMELKDGKFIYTLFLKNNTRDVIFKSKKLVSPRFYILGYITS